MRLWRVLFAAALCGLVLGVAACGGDEAAQQTTLTGAETVPADVPLYMSFDTNLESEQWQAAQDLLDKFPGKEKLLNQIKSSLADEDVDFERDVRPVLGTEIGVALLDLQDDDTFVGLTQPKDEAKLNALLEKGDDPFVHTKIDSWTLFARSQAVLDRFRQAQSGEKLSGSDVYKEAVQSLPEEALFKLYFGGPQLQKAIREGLAGEGAPQGLAGRFDNLRSTALALTAETGGVRLEADVVTGSEIDLDTYDAELPNALPGGALLYVSFANLDKPTREVLSAIEDAVPNFDEQRRQAEQAFGFSIENDLLPLLKNEGAFAIYPAKPLPAFVFALAGDDQEAVRLMDRFGALVAIGQGGKARQQEIEGITIKELAFTSENFSIFYAAVDGVFVASNVREQVLAANRDGPKLADDAVYQAAVQGTDAEGGTVAFVYGNLKDGLPFVFDFAEDQGETVPEDARSNIEPLQSFLISASQDGNRFELSGFLAIK
jgi:uncharacterized protein DUF3352